MERKEFDNDFYAFRNRIKELERRLGAVLTQGFDDAGNIYARFKLLDSFDTLLERPLIQASQCLFLVIRSSITK